MKVKDIMINDIATCKPDSNLAVVAKLMWDRDCGVVPVTDDEGKPVGMITDRDISIAGATQNRLLSEIPVSAVKDGNAITCSGDLDVKEALKLMGISRVRRLPVVDDRGKVIGLLSMGDIVASAPETGDGAMSNELPYADVINTLKSVYVHH
jgi:CBS domain-containing protein